ncbi:hypothetical protein JTL55_34010, partial [Pseudomonas aeruginosa]|nr:hypothetical protein [Pseudomonas aeruginosa]
SSPLSCCANVVLGHRVALKVGALMLAVFDEPHANLFSHPRGGDIFSFNIRNDAVRALMPWS